MALVVYKRFGPRELFDRLCRVSQPYLAELAHNASPMYRSAGRVKGTQSQLTTMAVRGQWFLEELEHVIGLASRLYTLLAFVGALLIVPIGVVTYIVVRGVQNVFVDFLQRRYPHLEFVRKTSLRTAIDTHRNQGIISLLLQVRGVIDPDLVKAKLQENVVERRDANGALCYPHMKTSLTTKWGRYAWEKAPLPFLVDDHISVGNAVFRGRPVTELNIQEYVSDIVTKYLSPEHSPWQLTIIPSPSESRSYLLIRIHHLILSEDRVGLGDLLLLKHEKSFLSRRLGEDDENFLEVDPKPYQPLINLSNPPVALPKLYQSLRQSAVEKWTKFKAEYDNVDESDQGVVKSAPTLVTCAVVAFMTTCAVLTEYFRGDDASKGLMTTLRIESHRRNCTIKMFFFGLVNSLSPKRLVKVLISGAWWLTIRMTLKLPLSLLRECLAFSGNSSEYPGTTTEWLSRYASLITTAAKEAWYYWTVLYTGPRILLEELILSHQLPKHQLQTVSLCGRKVVAWSDPVPLELVRKIKDATGVTQSEILTNATAGALRDYFRQFGLAVPDTVLATARFFPEETLLATSRTFETGISPSTGGGSLCLALPTSSLQGNASLAGLQATSQLLKQTRTRQPILFLASLWQLEKGLMTQILPTVVVRLILNYLTRRYTVSLTEVASNCGSEARRQMLWGQDVESVMYWRPPQANICLSLTMMSYGESVRLGVMSDALLSPQHAVLASGFLQQLHELALAAGIPRDRQTPSPTPGPSGRFPDHSMAHSSSAF